MMGNVDKGMMEALLNVLRDIHKEMRHMNAALGRIADVAPAPAAEPPKGAPSN